MNIKQNPKKLNSLQENFKLINKPIKFYDLLSFFIQKQKVPCILHNKFKIHLNAIYSFHIQKQQKTTINECRFSFFGILQIHGKWLHIQDFFLFRPNFEF